MLRWLTLSVLALSWIIWTPTSAETVDEEVERALWLVIEVVVSAIGKHLSLCQAATKQVFLLPLSWVLHQAFVSSLLEVRISSKYLCDSVIIHHDHRYAVN